jgi:hypothetical protein
MLKKIQLEIYSILHNNPIPQGTSSREGYSLKRLSHENGRDIHFNICTNFNIEI